MPGAGRLGSPHLGAHAVRAMSEMRGDQLAASIRTIAPRPVILLTDFEELMQTRGEVQARVTLS